MLRQRKGRVVITPAGQKVLDDPAVPALSAMLFDAFWTNDLGYFSRGLQGN